MSRAVRQTGGALVAVEKELLQQAQVARATEESVQTGQFFGTRGGILTFNGAPIKENKMQVIVVDHILANVFYKGKFNPDDPVPPVCYAFGRDDKELVPHEKATDQQHEQCKGCPQNEWGTADTGRGKACKNSRRLACIAADVVDSGNVQDAQVAYLAVPVTSVKGWAGYVRQLADVLRRPPLGVVTEVSLVPDAKDQFKMVFRSVEPINDKKVLGQLLAKQKAVSSDIAFPFPEIDEEERARRRPAKPAGRGRTKAKAGSKARGKAKPAPAAGGRAAAGANFGARAKFTR